MRDFDTWLSTNPADAEQERFERWMDENEDQLEGLNTFEIEAIYEDLREVPYEDDEYEDDHDIYRDVEEYEDY